MPQILNRYSDTSVNVSYLGNSWDYISNAVGQNTFLQPAKITVNTSTSTDYIQSNINQNSFSSIPYQSTDITLTIQIRWTFLSQNPADTALLTGISVVSGSTIVSNPVVDVVESSLVNANSGITTTYISFDNYSEILTSINGNFGILFRVDTTNDSNVSQNIYVYDINFLVSYNEPFDPFFDAVIPGPDGDQEIQVLFGGVDISNQTSINGGTLLHNSVSLKTFRIKNIGSEPLFLNSGGITCFSGGTITSSPVSSSGINILTDSYVDFILQPNTSTISTSTPLYSYISILSNDTDESTFKFKFGYFVDVAQTSSPIIQLYKSTFLINNSDQFGLGSFAINQSYSIIITIKNSGVDNLVIPQGGMSKTGNGSIINNPTSSTSITIASGGTQDVSIALDSSSLGPKSLTLYVSSNDLSNNPYQITLNYTIQPPYELLIDQDFTDYANGDTVSLGILNKNSTFSKTLVIKNGGITDSIMISGISSIGDITLSNIPSLPITLLPNEENSYKFTSTYKTNTSGSKSGSILVEWEPI